MEIKDMPITQLQETFVKAMKKKFGDRMLSTEGRICATHAQLSELYRKFQFEKGQALKDRTHNTPQHLVASVFPDLFMLCEIFQVDLIEELQECLEWWKKDVLEDLL